MLSFSHTCCRSVTHTWRVIGMKFTLGCLLGLWNGPTPDNLINKSIKVGGKQRLETFEGYAMPIIFKNGLAYIKTLGRPNDQELETYPHVFFTSPDTSEPSLLGHEFSPEDEITWSQHQDTRPFHAPLFDAQGDLNQRIIATLNTFLDSPDHNDTSTFNISSTS